ncbi:hypothetical protein ACFQ1E_18980 [Sphingomonas canadensis]|uniref:Uncharacterized protein n=1 Tax=Sphingomonas canadensis TaxID=1219257 RepID=A0ABW3HCK9_9SPHN|nr:hypothetical protein [Sphingomonas canadensis]MCW3838031.1 hypothetical protein [Sphingomonas canadensis]
MPSYATLARQLLDAPLVIDASIISATRIKPAQAPGVAPGRGRFYIEADVLALIRGNANVPARIGYMADLPLDARGKPPKLKKLRVLLFARLVPGRAGIVQLSGGEGQRNWYAELDGKVRAITREILAADAPAAVSDIANAFHVPGSIPGEGETQIFVETAGGGQISIQVLRRPGQPPRWSVATGDFIDESAGTPAKDTLLWYRLACGLPPALPPASLEADDPANSRVAQEDYRTVLRELGPCA